MMGLDKPETFRGWRNVLGISCASSWFFFTRLYRDARSTKHKKNLDVVTKYQWSLIFNNRAEAEGCVMLHHVG